MKAFSLFQIPQKDLVFIRENFYSSNVDWKRFNFSNKKDFLDLIWDYFPGYNLLDCDNSNSRFFRDAVFLRVHSNLGLAFQYVVSIVGIWTVPICMVTVYSSWLKDSVGRIDFYGAFFHFREYLSDRISKLYDYLDSEYIKPNSFVRCTRIDCAIDIAVPFPVDASSFFVPASRDKVKRKKVVKCYNPVDNVFQSVSYLPKKNSGYGVRMYNKIMDIKDKGKEFWYQDSLPVHLTRIEFEFYPPYSNMNTSESMLQLCLSRIFWVDIKPLGLHFRPALWFNVENAYEYFCRYAKNKGITIGELIIELQNYHLEMERQKYQDNLSLLDV